MKNKKQRRQIAGLIIALMVVLVGGVVFMGAVSGWFGASKIVLGDEYHCRDQDCDGDNFLELRADEYDNLVNAKKSFVVFVDKDGCVTASKMREFIIEYIDKNNIRFYRIAYEDMKESLLHNKIKYYPSVAIVSNGNVVAWLRSDSDDDTEKYNNREALINWLDTYLK